MLVRLPAMSVGIFSLQRKLQRYTESLVRRRDKCHWSQTKVADSPHEQMDSTQLCKGYAVTAVVTMTTVAQLI